MTQGNDITVSKDGWIAQSTLCLSAMGLNYWINASN